MGLNSRYLSYVTTTLVLMIGQSSSRPHFLRFSPVVSTRSKMDWIWKINVSFRTLEQRVESRELISLSFILMNAETEIIDLFLSDTFLCSNEALWWRACLGYLTDALHASRGFSCLIHSASTVQLRPWSDVLFEWTS